MNSCNIVSILNRINLTKLLSLELDLLLYQISLLLWLVLIFLCCIAFNEIYAFNFFYALVRTNRCQNMKKCFVTVHFKNSNFASPNA